MVQIRRTLCLSRDALSISSTFIVYALYNIETARRGSRNLHKIDAEWDIFTYDIE